MRRPSWAPTRAIAGVVRSPLRPGGA